MIRLQAEDPRVADWDDAVRRATTMLSMLLDDPPALELTTSCTAALEAAAAALDLGPGDEVVVPAFTFPSTAAAFSRAGATLRFADVDPATANISAERVEELLSERTAAVVCMHYAGVACELDTLDALCASAGAALIEDAAHGLFGSFADRPLGRVGSLAAFSFHRTKNVSSVEGGALVVNDPDLVDRVQIALDKGTNRAQFLDGKVQSYEWSGVGSAGRMAPPIASLLLEALEHAPAIQARRHLVFDSYAERLTPWAERVGARVVRAGSATEHPAHIFWVLLPDGVEREAVTERCAVGGVEVARHYGSLPDTAQGRRVTAAAPSASCPVASTFGRQLIRLPLHHQMELDDAERVADTLIAAVGR